jgi:hypothetical protein
MMPIVLSENPSGDVEINVVYDVVPAVIGYFLNPSEQISMKYS